MLDLIYSIFYLLLITLIFWCLTTYNDTAVSKAHSHRSLAQDLAGCDIIDLPHSKCLSFHSFSALDIANHLAARLKFRPKSFLKRKPSLEDLSPVQKQGLQLLASCNLTLHAETNVFPLQCPVDAFNLIFFDGLIDRNKISLQWTDYHPDLGWLGLTTILVMGKPQLKLEVARFDREHTLDITSRAHPYASAQSYARMLLHEMTHAVLMQYTCRRCEIQYKFGYKLSTTGWDGHGPAFQSITHAIENAAGPLVGDAFGVSPKGSNYRGRWVLSPGRSILIDTWGIELATEWQGLMKKARSIPGGNALLRVMAVDYVEPLLDGIQPLQNSSKQD